MSLPFMSQIRKQNLAGTPGEWREASTRTAEKSFRAQYKEKKNPYVWELSSRGAGTEVRTWARLAMDGAFFFASHHPAGDKHA